MKYLSRFFMRENAIKIQIYCALIPDPSLEILSIICDVLAYALPFGFVADDVFVIIALPYGNGGGISVFINSFCGGGFK